MLAGCALMSMLGFGWAGFFWLASATQATPTPRPTIEVVRFSAPPTATPTATPSPTVTPPPTASPTFTPPLTDTPIPTATASPSPSPTPTSTAIPPSPTPIPTATPSPVPQFDFTVKELDKFDTNHPNFDVYVAVVNDNNRPLGDYRVIGTHSTGLQVESPPSANDWTENSGAMHYKAGNIKFQAANSPGGVWTLQLVDAQGQPAAEPVPLDFDSAHPSWYFIIFERDK